MQLQKSIVFFKDPNQRTEEKPLGCISGLVPFCALFEGRLAAALLSFVWRPTHGTCVAHFGFWQSCSSCHSNVCSIVCWNTLAELFFAPAAP